MTETIESIKPEEQLHTSLEDQKAELAELYLSFLDSKKDGVLAAASGMGVSLNPLKENAKKYLLSQDKKKGLFEKFADNVKNALIKKVSKDVNLNLEYSRKELDSMKVLLKQADTPEQLTLLKKQIEEGKDPTASNDLSGEYPSPKKKADILPVDPVLTLAALTPELKAIRENVEIHEDFANIKKIKNADGKVILECTAETPFINVKAIDDLLGLADAFFKKTGEALTLNSAYRTIEHQEQLKKTNDVPTAQPGKSGHNLGLSIDVEKTDKKEKALGGLQGFRDLAKQYHFNPIASEDWHFDHETLPKSDERLDLAQSLDKEFQEEQLAT